MSAAGVVSLIATIASLIGSGISQGKKMSDQNALTRWQEKQKELEDERQKKEIARYNKEAKKSAIARAIGSQNVLMPTKKIFTPTPIAPEINPVDVGGIIQGVGQGVSQISGGIDSGEFNIGRGERNVPTYNQSKNRIDWGY